MVIPTSKTCYFEASITKFKSQALNVIKIKYLVATLPPSFPPSENCHFRSKNEIFYTFLHTTVAKDLTNVSTITAKQYILRKLY